MTNRSPRSTGSRADRSTAFSSRPVGAQATRVSDSRLVSGGDLPIEAYVLNVTVASTTGAGHLSVAPDPYSTDAYRNGRPVPPPRPTSSALNWTAGKDVSNLVQAKPGPHEIVDLWNQSSREVHYIVDWFGEYDAY
ncbi:hypothetical protein ACWDA9_22150 [Streptomyces sp. NPDC001193]